MQPNNLTIGVVSDLHCKLKSGDNGTQTTWLYSDLLREPASMHPVQSLINLAEIHSLKANILLCPGDVTDRIDIQGFITGWSFVEEIKEAFKANEVYATLGNHDVNSMKVHNLEPFEVAKGVKKSYPFRDEKAKLDFWSNHFCIIKNNQYALLIFNSVHNYSDTRTGIDTKITNAMLDKMESQLSELSKDIPFRIAMCHHHPVKHAVKDYSDNDVIDKGDKFLDLLIRNNFQILIHGHKHEPKIRYYNSMPVFCAGSFSSFANIRETNSANVFHIITLEKQRSRGQIHTWEFTPSSGWIKRLSDVFPSLTGFGHRGDLNALASRINEWLAESRADVSPYNKLERDFPEISYLIPEDKKELSKVLLDRYFIEFTYTHTHPDKPHFISRQFQ